MIAVDGHATHSARRNRSDSFCSRRLIRQQDRACRSIEGFDGAAVMGEIHHAIVNNRGGLLPSRFHGVSPRHLESTDIVAIDLRQWTVAKAAARAAPGDP